MAVAPNYIFWPDLADEFLNHVEIPGCFSPPECEAIIQMGLSYPEEKATISQDKIVEDSIRSSSLHWIECRKENEWLWHKLAEVIQRINKKHYHFKLLGFKECIQFTKYFEPGDHYGWHMDYGTGRMSQRKLSAVIQLTDPNTYEGGNTELLYGSEPAVAGKQLGTLILFPSYTMHRVTPVTKGTRYSAVVWTSGHESYR